MDHAPRARCMRARALVYTPSPGRARRRWARPRVLMLWVIATFLVVGGAEGRAFGATGDVLWGANFGSANNPQLVPRPGGGVIAGFFQGETFSLRVLGPDGAILRSPTPGPPPYPDHRPAVAADGSFFVEGGRQDISLIYGHEPDGSVLWEQQLPPDVFPAALAIGGGGDLFAVIETTSTSVVRRVDPLTGATVWQTPPIAGAFAAYSTRLYRRSDGVALVKQGRVWSIGSDGAVSGPVAALDDGYPFDRDSAANASGEIFLSAAASPGISSGACLSGIGPVTVAKVRTDGVVAWSRQLGDPTARHCEARLAAMPDGGVAVAIGGSFDRNQIEVLNSSDGSTRWSKSYPVKDHGNSPVVIMGIPHLRGGR